MRMFILLLAFVMQGFAFPTAYFQKEKNNGLVEEILTLIGFNNEVSSGGIPSSQQLKNFFETTKDGLSPPVIDKVLTSLQCAREYNIEHNNLLVIIDYSLPSSEKRFWVYDLINKQLLYHTYVSHGLNSGVRLSTNFSNKYNSRASSIGVYTTDKAYQGREGLSLRLDGLDRGFNDNASNRAVVMHGGWYVEENFIKKYGRAGRSWGCPALPLNSSSTIINAIKDKSLFVIYYPNDTWFTKSKFLNCTIFSSAKSNPHDNSPFIPENASRGNILFLDLNHNKKREENEPILVISADKYEQLFQGKPPLERMLRRQIGNTEYIALIKAEFAQLNNRPNPLEDISFVIPTIKMHRGYYATEMKVVNLGKITGIRLQDDSSYSSSHYIIQLEAKPYITILSTDQFIRWLGL